MIKEKRNSIDDFAVLFFFSITTKPPLDTDPILYTLFLLLLYPLRFSFSAFSFTSAGMEINRLGGD